MWGRPSPPGTRRPYRVFRKTLALFLAAAVLRSNFVLTHLFSLSTGGCEGFLQTLYGRRVPWRGGSFLCGAAPSFVGRLIPSPDGSCPGHSAARKKKATGNLIHNSLKISSRFTEMVRYSIVFSLLSFSCRFYLFILRFRSLLAVLHFFPGILFLLFLSLTILNARICLESSVILYMWKSGFYYYPVLFLNNPISDTRLSGILPDAFLVGLQILAS